MQQLTCNINLFRFFYYLVFSIVLTEPKPFVLQGKVLSPDSWGNTPRKVGKFMKKCENYETIFALDLMLPLSLSL